MILCMCLHCGCWIDTRADFSGVMMGTEPMHLACALTLIFQRAKPGH